MFTLGLSYVLVYLFIFLSLLTLSFSQLPIQFLTQLSTSTFLVILQKYTNFKGLFLFLIFALTGLPPVGLFFVKFNILAFVLYQTHLATMVGLFLIFFLNMLFYMQLFNVKNYKKQVYFVMNSDIFTIWQQNFLSKNCKTTYSTYILVLSIITILLFLSLTLFFFADVFLVLSFV